MSEDLQQETIFAFLESYATKRDLIQALFLMANLMFAIHLYNAFYGAAGLEGNTCSWNNYHLPTSVYPTQYNMNLDVQLQPPYQVEGQMEILVNVTKRSECMVLHAMDMDISNIKRLDTGEGGRNFSRN